jgi:hypothetical protein
VVETPHVLDESLLKVKAAFDDAVATPGDRNQKLAMLQPAVAELAESIQKSVDSPAEGTQPAGLTVADLTQALAPLYAKFESLEKRSSEPVERLPAQPIRRAISLQPMVNANQPVRKAGGLSSIIRRSVGLNG